MSIFDFIFGHNEDESLNPEDNYDTTSQAEIAALNDKLRELEMAIDEREEEYKLLEERYNSLQSRIDYATCELMNIEKPHDLSTALVVKENPTKEELIDISKAYNILGFRLRLIKEWMDDYEKKYDFAKNNLDLFLKDNYEEIKNNVIHDLYQRVTQCETSALRSLLTTIDTTSIDNMREQLKIHKHVIKMGIFGSEGEKYPLHPIINMCQNFILLNIANFEKEMKNTDWETIKSKISTIVGNVDYILQRYTNINFDDQYLESVCNYLEAKYLVVQKQEIEKEKEREEREAQREYQRAIKKALHDEEIAQQALEKKRVELANEQTQEKIKKLQDQILGLEQALNEARALRERAMSMAQQTKTGYVYIISNIGSFGRDVYKIGMTRRLDPMERVLELSNASVPFPFDVHAFIFSDDAPALEAYLHRLFDSRKINSINYRKEYFRISLEEIKKALNDININVEFVDEPDALQYRESMLNNHLNIDNKDC